MATTKDSSRSPAVPSHSSRSSRITRKHLGRGGRPGGVVDHHQQRRGGLAEEGLEPGPRRFQRRPEHAFGILRPLHVGAQHPGYPGFVDLHRDSARAPRHVDPHASLLQSRPVVRLSLSLRRLSIPQDVRWRSRSFRAERVSAPATRATGRTGAMEYHSYSISPEVFARFPGYVRGVVIAYEVTNGASPAELVADAARGGRVGAGPGGAGADRRGAAHQGLAGRLPGVRRQAGRVPLVGGGHGPPGSARRRAARHQRAGRHRQRHLPAPPDARRRPRHRRAQGRYRAEVRHRRGGVRRPSAPTTLEHPLPGEVIFVEGEHGAHPPLDLAPGATTP